MSEENEKHDFSEEELAMLGDDELAAIKEEEAGAGEEQEKVEAAEVEAQQEGVEPKGDDEPVAAAKEGEPDETSEASQRFEESIKKVQETLDNMQQKPDEAEEQEEEPDPLAALDQKLDDLSDKLSEGDIEYSDYLKEQTKLLKERQDVLIAKDRESIRKEVSEEFETREAARADAERDKKWNDAKSAFMAQPGCDVIESNPMIGNAFNAALQMVAEKDPNKSYAEMLEGARQMLSDNGITIGEKPKLAQEQRQTSRQKQIEIPQTLGSVPAAEVNDSSEFSHLNTLDGVDLEEAVAKMSPEKQDRWAAQA